jgi:hypothetical protein
MFPRKLRASNTLCLNLALFSLCLGASALWAPHFQNLDGISYRFQEHGAFSINQLIDSEKTAEQRLDLAPKAALNCQIGQPCQTSMAAFKNLGPITRLVLTDVSAPADGYEFDQLRIRSQNQILHVELLGGANPGLLDLQATDGTCQPLISIEGDTGRELKIKSSHCLNPIMDLGPGLVNLGALVADADDFEQFPLVLLYPLAGDAIPAPVPAGWLLASTIRLGWDEKYPWIEIERLIAEGELQEHEASLGQEISLNGILDGANTPTSDPFESPHPHLEIRDARPAGYSTSPPTAPQAFETLQLDFDDFSIE